MNRPQLLIPHRHRWSQTRKCNSEVLLKRGVASVAEATHWKRVVCHFLSKEISRRASSAGRVRRPLKRKSAVVARPSRCSRTNGARSVKPYPLVIIGAGALPLPTKQPPKLSAVTTKASASATFFIESPFYLRPFVARQRRVVFSVAEAAARPPVHTKKNQICIRLCIERDGAK